LGIAFAPAPLRPREDRDLRDLLGEFAFGGFEVEGALQVDRSFRAVAFIAKLRAERTAKRPSRRRQSQRPSPKPAKRRAAGLAIAMAARPERRDGGDP